MNVLFAINHPSQYHVLKYLADKLTFDGNQVCFLIKKNKDVLEELLISDNRVFHFSSSFRKKKTKKIFLVINRFFSLLIQEVSTFKILRRNSFNFLIGTDISISHMGSLFKIPSLIICEDDYELIKKFGNLAYPFAKYIVSPNNCNIGKWEQKRLGYFGSQKTAYLHPNYFSPNPEILKKYNLSDKRFFLIRLVSMNAYHDILEGCSGLSEKNAISLINFLKNYGEVLISSQNELPQELKPFELRIDPKDIHHIMYYADMFIGDSQSMTVESALLGTPAIRSNKWVIDERKVSVLEELEKKYELVFSIPPDNFELMKQTISKVFSITDYKEVWKSKSKKYFDENTDLTTFLFWFLKNYSNIVSSTNKHKDAIDKFNIYRKQQVN